MLIVCVPLEGRQLPDSLQVTGTEQCEVEKSLLLLTAEHTQRLRVKVLQQSKLLEDRTKFDLFESEKESNRQKMKCTETMTYLDALNEVSHREIVIEEDADQHLHHFTVQLKGEVTIQNQLEAKNKGRNESFLST